MKYGMFFVGANFYDHDQEVHPSNGYCIKDADSEHNWRVSVEDAKMSWAKKRYAWVRWMVIDDHDGKAPPTTDIQEVRHSLKTRVQLNAKAAPPGRAVPKKPSLAKDIGYPVMIDAAHMQQVYQEIPVQPNPELAMGQLVPDNQF